MDAVLRVAQRCARTATSTPEPPAAAPSAAPAPGPDQQPAADPHPDADGVAQQRVARDAPLSAGSALPPVPEASTPPDGADELVSLSGTAASGVTTPSRVSPQGLARSFTRTSTNQSVSMRFITSHAAAALAGSSSHALREPSSSDTAGRATEPLSGSAWSEERSAGAGGHVDPVRRTRRAPQRRGSFLTATAPNVSTESGSGRSGSRRLRSAHTMRPPRGAPPAAEAEPGRSLSFNVARAEPDLVVPRLLSFARSASKRAAAGAIASGLTGRQPELLPRGSTEVLASRVSLDARTGQASPRQRAMIGSRSMPVAAAAAAALADGASGTSSLQSPQREATTPGTRSGHGEGEASGEVPAASAEQGTRPSRLRTGEGPVMQEVSRAVQQTA
jgi:hypothetical protein